MPRGAVRPSGAPVRARLGAFAVGAALPLALQLLYVVCLPFAARLGPGAATSFVYAYLASSSLVTVTAGSLGIVTSVPLSRAGFGAGAGRAARRGDVVARAGARRRRGWHVRARGRSSRRGRPRRGLRRRHRRRHRARRRRAQPVDDRRGRRGGDLPARLRRGPDACAALDRARRARAPGAAGLAGRRGARAERPRARARRVDPAHPDRVARGARCARRAPLAVSGPQRPSSRV